MFLNQIMSFQSVVHIVSIMVELAIAFIGVNIVTRNHQSYGWGIALAYFIYALSSLAGFFQIIGISVMMMYLVRITATASMLWAVWTLMKSLKSDQVATETHAS